MGEIRDETFVQGRVMVESCSLERWLQITPRRAPVLGGLARGLSDREIAEELGVATFAVRPTSRELHAVVRLSNRRGLARWWRENGPDWPCAHARAANVECSEVARRWLRREIEGPEERSDHGDRAVRCGGRRARRRFW